MTHIIGFSGKLQSGKTTAVRTLIANELNNLGYRARIREDGQLMLVHNLETKEEGLLDIESKRAEIVEFLTPVWQYVKNYNFAEALKEFCIQVLGLSYESCYGTQEQKNEPTHLLWENMPGVFTTNYRGKTKEVQEKFGLIYHQPGQMTGREVLQYFGTNICRKMYNDCWVKNTIKRIQTEQPTIAILGDVRFRNEVLAIQAEGGKVIRLLRNPSPDNDKSETDLDDFTGFDCVIDNTNMNIPEQSVKIMEYLLSVNIYKMEEPKVESAE
jgi:hypothetical protein